MKYIKPSEWVLAGKTPNRYITYLDHETLYLGEPSLCLYSLKEKMIGHGTTFIILDGSAYSDKRIQLSGTLKTEMVEKYAGLWIRSENETSDLFGFDNNYPNLVFGTTSWKEYHITLDIPHNCQTLGFGVELNGSGKVWLNDVKLEIVDNTIPLTYYQIENV